jgi:hypothetical protein
MGGRQRQQSIEEIAKTTYQGIELQIETSRNATSGENARENLEHT